MKKKWFSAGNILPDELKIKDIIQDESELAKLSHKTALKLQYLFLEYNQINAINSFVGCMVNYQGAALKGFYKTEFGATYYLEFEQVCRTNFIKIHTEVGFIQTALASLGRISLLKDKPHSSRYDVTDLEAEQEAIEKEIKDLCSKHNLDYSLLIQNNNDNLAQKVLLMKRFYYGWTLIKSDIWA